MNKKILAVISIILLGGMSVATHALAQGSMRSPPVIPPQPRYPQVSVEQGIALDKDTLETQPAVFIEMKYGTKTIYYLIIDEDVYKMNKTYSKYDWKTGSRIFQYMSEDGDTLTLLAQRYSNGYIGFSAEFKNYIISFEPTYYYNHYYPRPVKTVTKPQITKQIEEGTGIDIENILKKPIKPIAEWVS